MSTIFDGLTFSVKDFATYPKCKGRFFSNDGSGCLLTAFMVGFGFGVNNRKGVFVNTNGDEYNAGVIQAEITDLAEQLGVAGSTGKSFDGLFTSRVIRQYDSGDQTVALNMLWELIDKLPKRMDVVSKSEVQMPVCAL